MPYVVARWLDKVARFGVLYGTGDPAAEVTSAFAPGTTAYRRDGGDAAAGWYEWTPGGAWVPVGALAQAIATAAASVQPTAGASQTVPASGATPGHTGGGGGKQGKG